MNDSSRPAHQSTNPNVTVSHTSGLAVPAAWSGPADNNTSPQMPAGEKKTASGTVHPVGSTIDALEPTVIPGALKRRTSLEADDESNCDDNSAGHGPGIDTRHITHTSSEARARVGAGAGESGQAPNNADPEALGRVVSGPVYSVFSHRMKIYIIVLVTMTSFISPLTANIYFPALNPIAKDLGVSVGLINLTLTTYMILQGIAPTLFGDFGDMAGRRPAFIIALVIYLFINIGLALQDNYAALLVLRMLQSGGSSGTLALGYAVVADISVSAERGKYMGIVGAGINVGPAISPVLGGILSQYLGWRSIFWFCCILSGVLLVPYALTVPETSRNVVGNGSIPPRWINMTVLDMIHHRRHPPSPEVLATVPKNKIRFPNPLRTLYVVMEKDLSLILLYAGLLYVVFIMIVATLSTIFADLYGLNNLQIGLCYLPYGVGCCIAAIAQGHILDWNYRRIARKIGFTIDYKRGDDLSTFPIELARTQPMVPLLVVGVLTTVAYGWVLEYRQPLAAPLVLLFVIGLTIVGSFGILNTFIMDLYPQAPATAVAAVNLVRCLLGAGVMAFIEAMLQRLGRGWTFTFWALLCAAFSPVLYVVYRGGPRWREERRVRLAKKKAAEEGEMRRKEDVRQLQGQQVQQNQTEGKRSSEVH